MGDNTKDIILYIISILIVIVPLLRELFKNLSKLGRSIYIIFLILAGSGLILLGIDKITRNNSDQTQMQANLDIIKAAYSSDTTENRKFLNALSTKFNIVKDANNQPKENKTFNTHIRNAKTVNIGND